MGKPWKEDQPTPGLWTPNPDPWKPSIRNDELWARTMRERLAQVEMAHAWRRAAEADGWTFAPTYGDHEPVESAWRGERNGFVIQGLSRPGGEKSMAAAEVTIWGPDGLQIQPPLEYAGMDDLRTRTRCCDYCDAKDVDTARVGFAGRVCPACDPKVRPMIETPGWTK